MSAEIKPCMFCGSKKTSITAEACASPVYWIACDDCGAEGPGKPSETEVIAAWNAAWEAREKLAEALESLVGRIYENAEWDEGCFYYHHTSASELIDPLDKAKAAIALHEGRKA